jgi:cytochrome c553
MLEQARSAALAALFTLAFTGLAAQAQDSANDAANSGIESKAAICASCHGQEGKPVDARTMPNIWGQNNYYIVKQLSDYRNGTRGNAIMASIAKSLDHADLRPMAAYFAAKKAPATTAAAAPAPAAEKIAVCVQCHQQNFVGGLPAPRLAGLNADYLLAQMNAFADGKRTNNLDMPQLMRDLTPADREQIAKYLASL